MNAIGIRSPYFNKRDIAGMNTIPPNIIAPKAMPPKTLASDA
jgi:hypothetical protein